VGPLHMEHLSKRHVDHDMPSFEMPLERKKSLYHLNNEKLEGISIRYSKGIVLKSILKKVAI